MLNITEFSDNVTDCCGEVSKKIQELSFLDVDAKYHSWIKKMLAPFADMWSGKLESVDTVRHRSDLMKNSRPLCSAPN